MRESMIQYNRWYRMVWDKGFRLATDEDVIMKIEFPKGCDISKYNENEYSDETRKKMV